MDPWIMDYKTNIENAHVSMAVSELEKPREHNRSNVMENWNCSIMFTYGCLDRLNRRLYLWLLGILRILLLWLLFRKNVANNATTKYGDILKICYWSTGGFKSSIEIGLGFWKQWKSFGTLRGYISAHGPHSAIRIGEMSQSSSAHKCALWKRNSLFGTPQVRRICMFRITLTKPLNLMRDYSNGFITGNPVRGSRKEMLPPIKKRF